MSEQKGNQGVAASSGGRSGGPADPNPQAVSAVPAPPANAGAVYAIPPVSHRFPREPYITAGRRYLVVQEGASGFSVIDDDGERIFCLWKNCAHIDGGSWERVEVASGIEAATADETALAGSAEGESPTAEGRDAQNPPPANP